MALARTSDEIEGREDLLRVSLNVRLPWFVTDRRGDPGNLSVELKRKIHTVLVIYGNELEVRARRDRVLSLVSFYFSLFSLSLFFLDGRLDPLKRRCSMIRPKC